MNGTPWSEEELAVLRRDFPHQPSAIVAQTLQRSLSSVNGTAAKHGLRKTQEYLDSPAACRLRRGDNVGAAHRFKKGQTPPNKGLRRRGWAPGRMAETQFKPGQEPANYCPVGTVKKDTEGFLRIKVRDRLPGEATGFGSTKVWPLLNRHTWEQHHGQIPPGHSVVFKDGNRDNCDISNLDCISRADLMRRNTIHNLPKELVEVIHLTGAIKRKIRERHAAEQAI